MKKIEIGLVVLIVSLFIVFGLIASPIRYPIPNPHFSIVDLNKYPTSCNIYIASDGLFYYEYPGYHINNFGEKTVEEAFLAAKSWVEWKIEKDSKTYNLIDTYNF